jgi:SNF2 family DNA or RNA helicase
MSKVSFHLNVPTQKVSVRSTVADESWVRIRRVFASDTDHVEPDGDLRIELPLWLLLSKREALAFRLDEEEIDFSFDKSLTAILARTVSQVDEYQDAATTQLISSQALKSKLERHGFRRKLKSYQTRNVRKLLRQTSGATFSVPGAGKTSEGLAFFAASAGRNERLLVIAPKNAFAAWETQFELCFPHSREKFQRLAGGRKQISALLEADPRFAIISYRQLHTVLSDILMFLAKEPTAVFLDESHRMKGGLSRETGRNVLQLSGLPTRKLLLSGTPMPNSRTDMVSQVQFLFPFKRVDETNVLKIIEPIYVRTTKDELGLRRPDRLSRVIEMSPAQSELYGLIANEEARRLSALKPRDKIQLRTLGRSVIRLLQAASNPILVLNTASMPAALARSVMNDDDSPKIRFACERARQLAKAGHKVVIWSTFVDTIELVASRLLDIGADYIHGGIDAGSEFEEETRERKIRDFHIDDRKSVLVASPASCGEGISLHEVCHNAIYLDRNFNAGQYLQSEDRIHRLGLAKNQRTVVEVLMSPETVDDSVRNRLNAKVRAMGKALNDKGLDIDPISLDPDTLSDDEALDEADVQSLLDHLKSYA